LVNENRLHQLVIVVRHTMPNFKQRKRIVPRRTTRIDSDKPRAPVSGDTHHSNPHSNPKTEQFIAVWGVVNALQQLEPLKFRLATQH
jgi:hypothetical protein